ncbi:hypothetical protein HA402_005586 [Bradysia odoriphaga]|nr:hypothetical protein HA402_005586 [Bradysia odoriphaga]
MQENNEKLLLLVRDLSTKLEEMEEIQNSIDVETYEAKCASYEKRLQDAEQARSANEELLGNCLKEKDRYKQMVCDLMKENHKPMAGDQTHMTAMDVGDAAGLNGSFGASKEANDKKVADLEQMLDDKVKQLQELKEEYSEFRKECKNNIKSMNEQFQSERNELRELTTANCKLQTQATFLTEQIKTQQNNVGIYKNKIQSLEERNQMHEKTIAKHETAAKYMREEAQSTMKKLQTLEARCEHFQRENNKIINENRHLEMQYQLLSRERVTNSTLQNNLEMIRGSFERWETDGRAKMEQRLDDTSRECFALRRRLQEEQDEYRRQIAKIKSETEDSEKKINDQVMEVETLRSQLKNAQAQLELKNQQLDELINKTQNSPTMTHIDVPAIGDNAKIKELELQVLNAAAEIQKLTAQNSASAAREARLRQVATEWEEEALKQKESFDTWKSKMAADLEAAQLSEAKLTTKVDELQTEIRLQAMETDSSMYDAAAENKARMELKDALQKISERERELRDLRTETNQLKIDLKTIEQKYSNEMQVHSADIQALTMCKDELNKCQEQIDQVRAEKDVAIDILKASQSEFENLNKKLNEDKMELEQKLEYLNNQNTALHDHLQAQCNKAGSTNDSMNESINSSFLNRSLTDDEAKEVSSNKLLKVITYLRQEKDCSVTKLEILKNENTRLLSEIELLKKRLTEQSHQLSVAKAPINAPNAVSASKYEELMRKVETLNSVTESNIHLRAEKEALAAKVNDLTERVTKVEDELFPLQEKNRELTAKNEEQAHVNQMLRNNVDHWRKRSSDLVDRNNKNPEEFKRLQNERENLAKMLTVEKNTVSNVNAQLAAMTNEKAKTEQELAANVRLLHTTAEEKKKIQDDLNALKQQNARLTQEIIEIKSQILKKEDDIKAVQTELTSKENLILEIKKKEIQIRQIAKKYKDSYFDLKSNVDTRQADLAAKPLEEQAAATNDADAAGLAARAEQEKIQAKKVEELSNQLLARQEEIEQLQKEIENLKKQDDKNLLADARNRIAALTETNRQITRDYQVSKTQLQSCEQSRSEHDSVVAALKSQLEAKMKELLDQEAARQETIARLTRENETLNTRVNQFHRQFQQQGSKPSTSSGTNEKSPSDAARTANVKPMATPSAQQSATVNPRRGGDTPLASIRPVPVQNSRIAAVLPTSQTSNVAAVQGSSSSAGNVTTALVPPQQQVHTTGNTSTAEAMSSSPTSSHTDYMPATSSAAVVVAAVPPMGSASAESTQEAESLSVNTNESSSSSSTSSQAVVQQQTVALVSPRVEVVPQNVSVPSVSQVVDQAASTSGSSSSSFITAMSSHHQASSSNTVTTSQAGHKRPRDADGDSSTGVEESSASEKNSPQNKRTRVGEQTFQGVTESGLDVEYQVPTSSQRDQEDDVVAVDSEDEDEENMDDEAVAVEDENFDADNGDTDEIESFGQDDGEVIDMDEDVAPNDNNEVDVDDSSNAPNQSSSGLAASSEARGTPAEVIELSPSGQENQQIQMISSGSDAGSSSQANLWRQAQTPSRQQQQQQQQQQQSLVIQQAYEEMTDDSIVPSTPTLYVARRADGFSEAVSSPHPTVPHGSRFTFGESNANRTVVASIEGMDDTRVELNLLDGTGDSGQSSSANPPAQQDDDVVVVDLSDDYSYENKEADQRQPVAGPSTEGAVPQITVTDAENDQNTFDDSASTSQLTGDQNDATEADAQDDDDVDTDGVSSGQDGVQGEDREAESTQMVTDKRTTRQTRQDSQRLVPIVWDGDSSPQQRGINRGTLNRGQVGRGRGRGKRPFHS